MRTIGLVLGELATAFVIGIVAFFVLLVQGAGLLELGVLGLASGLFLLVALCEGAWCLGTHDHHPGITAVAFLAYAAIPFALIVVVFHCWAHAIEWPECRRHRALERIGRLRLAKDARFEPKAWRIPMGRSVRSGLTRAYPEEPGLTRRSERM